MAVAVADAAADAGPAPHCTLIATGAPARAPAPAPESLDLGVGEELGGAIRTPKGFAVGMLRAVDGGRLASVARLGPSSVASLDLGVSFRDAPAPQPLVRGEDLFAVAYVKPGSPPGTAGTIDKIGAHRMLAVYRLGDTAERLLELPTETDSSFSYDAIAAMEAASPVGAVVAWDADAGTPPHALVQLATLAPDLRSVRGVRSVRRVGEGADAGDAGDPRLALRTGGYWLTWIARRPEHPLAALPLPAGEVETVSEEATYGWIEAVALDAQGAPSGEPRRLTSTTGHVGKYAVHSDQGALLVVAEDDGAAAGRAGGALEQVIWRGRPDEALDVVHLVRSGVEEDTPPSLVAGASGDLWLSYLHVSGETFLGALPQQRGLPTPEPLLGHGRFLGELDGRLGLATVDGARWTLRWASCSR